MDNYIDFMTYSSDKFDVRGKSFADFINKMVKDYELHYGITYDDIRKIKYDKIANENPSALTGTFKYLIFNTKPYREFCRIVQNYALKVYNTHVQAQLNIGNSLLILFKKSKKDEMSDN